MEDTLISATHPAVLVAGPAVVVSTTADVRAVGTSLPGAWRALAAPRWLLAGAEDDVAPLLDEVLTGRTPVFGLAGVLLTAGGAEDVSGGTVWRDGVPTRRARAGDDAALAELWGLAVRGPRTPDDCTALLASDRVSDRVRAVHARRVLADDPAYVPEVLDQDALEVLRVLADVLLPQDVPDDERMDLAARVDARLATGAGDGWRYADLPADAEAYRAGLAELADLPGLDEAARHDAVTEPGDGAHLSAQQLSHWLEDATVDLVQQWLAHPAHLARAGYDGFASGGAVLLGFAELGLGRREAWEPAL